MPLKICVISNEQDRGAATVNAFLRRDVSYVRQNVPTLTFNKNPLL